MRGLGSVLHGAWLAWPGAACSPLKRTLRDRMKGALLPSRDTVVYRAVLHGCLHASVAPTTTHSLVAHSSLHRPGHGFALPTRTQVRSFSPPSAQGVLTTHPRTGRGQRPHVTQGKPRSHTDTRPGDALLSTCTLGSEEETKSRGEFPLHVHWLGSGHVTARPHGSLSTRRWAF